MSTSVLPIIVSVHPDPHAHAALDVTVGVSVSTTIAYPVTVYVVAAQEDTTSTAPVPAKQLPATAPGQITQAAPGPVTLVIPAFPKSGTYLIHVFVVGSNGDVGHSCVSYTPGHIKLRRRRLTGPTAKRPSLSRA